VKGVPGMTVTFKEIALRSLFKSGGPLAATHGFVFDGPGFDPKRASIRQLAFANLGVYTFGAHCVEVDVDDATGAVEVRRAWCAHDVGRAINPASCEGQIQGGFVQGMGYALTEAMQWNEQGWLITATLADYKIPGVLDSPPEIHPIVLEDPDPTHPVGAKGIGEPSLVGAAPAIANAIRNATGARVANASNDPRTCACRTGCAAMNIGDYPPQEPLSEAGAAYGAECWRRSEGIAFQEFAFGADPYQRLLVFAPPRPNGSVLVFWHGGGWTSGYKDGWASWPRPSMRAVSRSCPPAIVSRRSTFFPRVFTIVRKR
jgi:hypothetical protein